MATDNRTQAAEAEVKEVMDAADAAAEEVREAAEAAPVRKESSKRIKKAERREAKAARKAANKIEEKNSRPNNLLIGVLIFGVVVGMFAFVLGYNFFSKPANIEKYIAKNGGAESFSGMQVDAYSTADITAKGNSMNIDLTVSAEGENADAAKDYYKSEDGQDQLKYLAAYFLTGIKPQTRAFSADVKASVKLGDEELTSVEMTYKEAKKYLEDLQKEAEAAQEDSAADEDAAAEDAAAGEAEAADEAAAEEAADGAAEEAEAAEDAAEEAAETAEGEGE